MFKLFIVASLTVALVSSGEVKEQKQVKRGLVHALGDAGGSYEGHGHFIGGGAVKGYASGTELTGLAHNSAIQAKTAVRSQITAGSQAAFGAKVGYAQAALGAATTAQAALVGKQVIVQSLQEQLHDAEIQLQAEAGQYQTAQQAAHAAQDAAQQAQSQTAALSAAFAAAQQGAQGAAKVAAKSATVLASQQAMVQDARQRVASLSDQLHIALAELAQTENSAVRAAHAAHTAQANAAAAAGAVAANAVKGNSIEGHHYH